MDVAGPIWTQVFAASSQRKFSTLDDHSGRSREIWVRRPTFAPPMFDSDRESRLLSSQQRSDGAVYLSPSIQIQTMGFREFSNQFAANAAIDATLELAQELHD